MPKDRFSAQANQYAKYRPTYPPELFDYIFGFVNDKTTAWDCATGNGQAAAVLAERFKTVEATDISEEQLKAAVQKGNIHYRICPAEQTLFPDNNFDLITVATAYHWLDWNAFYAEATRVGKNACVVAAWAYNLFTCEDDAVTEIIHHFYYNVVHSYWDKERRFVEEAYKTVRFDFAPLPEREFEINKLWGKEDFLGYLSTWSAVQNFAKQNGTSPLPLIEERLNEVWTNETPKRFCFPLFLRLGRIEK